LSFRVDQAAGPDEPITAEAIAGTFWMFDGKVICSTFNSGAGVEDRPERVAALIPGYQRVTS
jgi:hypothetical protein